MHSPITDEQALLKNLAQGNRAVFWPLWIAHQDYLYHRCLKWMGGDVSQAQEVLSQVMLKAWDKLPQHAEKITNLKAWLTCFSHNFCVDIHRKRRRREIGIDQLEEIASDANDILSSDADSPDLIITHDELSYYIHHAIGTLSERLRVPFVLRFIHQLSCQEISQRLSISVNNTYKRIQQAREILQQRLRGYVLDGNDINLLQIDSNQSKPPQAKTGTIDWAKIEQMLEEKISYQVTAICLESQLLA